MKKIHKIAFGTIGSLVIAGSVAIPVLLSKKISKTYNNISKSNRLETALLNSGFLQSFMKKSSMSRSDLAKMSSIPGPTTGIDLEALTTTVHGTLVSSLKNEFKKEITAFITKNLKSGMLPSEFKNLAISDIISWFDLSNLSLTKKTVEQPVVFGTIKKDEKVPYIVNDLAIPLFGKDNKAWKLLFITYNAAPDLQTAIQETVTKLGIANKTDSVHSAIESSIAGNTTKFTAIQKAQEAWNSASSADKPAKKILKDKLVKNFSKDLADEIKNKQEKLLKINDYKIEYKGNSISDISKFQFNLSKGTTTGISSLQSEIMGAINNIPPALLVKWDVTKPASCIKVNGKQAYILKMDTIKKVNIYDWTYSDIKGGTTNGNLTWNAGQAVTFNLVNSDATIQDFLTKALREQNIAVSDSNRMSINKVTVLGQVFDRLKNAVTAVSAKENKPSSKIGDSGYQHITFNPEDSNGTKIIVPADKLSLQIDKKTTKATWVAAVMAWEKTNTGKNILVIDHSLKLGVNNTKAQIHGHVEVLTTGQTTPVEITVNTADSLIEFNITNTIRNTLITFAALNSVLTSKIIVNKWNSSTDTNIRENQIIAEVKSRIAKSLVANKVGLPSSLKSLNEVEMAAKIIVDINQSIDINLFRISVSIKIQPSTTLILLENTLVRTATK